MLAELQQALIVIAVNTPNINTTGGETTASVDAIEAATGYDIE
jgi:hypothetical protein